MAKAAAFPQPRSAPFMKVFEEEGVGFGEGKGKLSPESFPFPSPIFIPYPFFRTTSSAGGASSLSSWAKASSGACPRLAAMEARLSTASQGRR